MYEEESILEINVHHWTPEENCTHVVFEDGAEWCSWYGNVTKPIKTDN